MADTALLKRDNTSGKNLDDLSSALGGLVKEFAVFVGLSRTELAVALSRRDQLLALIYSGLLTKVLRDCSGNLQVLKSSGVDECHAFRDLKLTLWCELR